MAGPISCLREDTQKAFHKAFSFHNDIPFLQSIYQRKKGQYFLFPPVQLVIQGESVRGGGQKKAAPKKGQTVP